jgi:3alpha(or 20beta)-hydroxysteroid dehydrogenase
MGRLAGKVALISGGARGQGAAEARLFRAEGATVLVTDVLDDAGERLAAEIEATYLHLDVSREDDWALCMDIVRRDHGRLDVLVNNAGVMGFSPLETLSLDDYTAITSVNQVGCFLGMRSAVSVMKSNGGSIVNTSSTLGLVGSAGMGAYVASKFAIRGMTKVAAIEFAPYGVRVNSVHPGGIDTDMARSPEMSQSDIDAHTAGWPISRLGLAEEVANLVLFLASDDSSFCTGAEFVVDGGATSSHI